MALFIREILLKKFVFRVPIVMNTKRGLNEYACCTKSANEIFIQSAGHCIGKM